MNTIEVGRGKLSEELDTEFEGRVDLSSTRGNDPRYGENDN